jgi:hypothetical protein
MPEDRKSNVALSIDRAIYSEMQRQAEQAGISLNAILNQVLDQYVSVYRILDVERCLSIQGQAFSFLLEICDESQFSNIISQFLLDNIRLIHKIGERSFTLEDMLRFFAEYGPLLGWYTHFEHHKDSEGYTNLMFGHNHGSKWSNILGIATSKLAENSLNLPAKYLPSPNLVTVKILLRRI